MCVAAFFTLPKHDSGILKDMRFPLIILATIGVLCLLFVFVTEGERSESNYTHITPSEDVAAFRAQWGAYLEAHDGEALLFEIEERFKEDGPYDQHFAAHIAGELLYEHDGADALSVCTSLYGFGCYHGFISSAISEGGEAAIEKLDRTCVEALGAPLETETCQHGVGHGILEYVGYTNVDAALALCKETDDILPALGCKSGVYMEYFNPMSDTVADAQSLVPTFDSRDPLSVCDDADEDAMRTCMFEAHSWWHDTARLSVPEIGRLCDMAPNASVRSFCYLGHGNYIAPQFDFDIARSVAHCDLMEKNDGKAMCRAGVFWRLHFEKGIPVARLACDGLSPALFNTCIDTASFACELEGTCEEIAELKK